MMHPKSSTSVSKSSVLCILLIRLYINQAENKFTRTNNFNKSKFNRKMSKKLKISALKVSSFVTEPTNSEKIMGGTGTFTITGELTKQTTGSANTRVTCPAQQ